MNEFVIAILAMAVIILVIAKIIEFDEESRLSKLPSPTLKRIKNLMENENEPKSETTEQSNSGETIRTTSTSKKAKRVQTRVPATIRRSKKPARQRDAGAAKRATENRRGTGKKV